jgi:Zn-finger nucleic acid-binding protein
MNLEVEVCPQGHGTFVDAERLTGVIEDRTLADLRTRFRRDGEAALKCPRCSNPLHSTELEGLPTKGCPKCGSMWYESKALEEFGKAWRRRAYGASSFAARSDVFEETAKVYAAEIIVGVLTELDLPIDE